MFSKFRFLLVPRTESWNVLENEIFNWFINQVIKVNFELKVVPLSLSHLLLA